MPTFDFTSPDGKSYSVDGPDGATPEQAFQILQQHLSPPQEGSSLGGIAKSLGTGLAQGAIGLAGLPADLAHLYADKNDPNPLGSEGIQKSIEGYTGEFHKPQGTAEDIASKVGQFLPAMAGGPESLATKFATRVAAPAIGSEAGGAIAGPVGEVAGALTGAMAGPAAFNKAIKAFKPAAAEASLSDIKAASRAGYQHPDVADVRINPDATLELADKIRADLQHGPNSGFRPANEPKVFSAVDELGTAANQGRPATVADIDNVRQVLGNAAKEKDAIGQPTRQAAAASRAIGHIDNFLPSLNQSDLLAGNAQNANAILGEARQNWGAYKRAQAVQTTAENGLTNASAAHSGGNVSNSVRQAFKPFVKNDFAKAIGYTDEEKTALKRIVGGTVLGNIARTGSKLLGAGGGLGAVVGGEVGYHEGGLPGLVGGALAGKALRKISDKSTLNAVAKLDKMLRSRAPEALKMVANAPPQVVANLPPASVQRLQSLIAADPLLREQVAQPVPAGG